MTRTEIDQLLASLPQGKLVETHISWLLLAGNLVFKIKKPVKFSFLDFSTLEKRQFYCHREVLLNRRFTRNIYLDVVPIVQQEDRPALEKNDGPVIDFAVKMHRMDDTRYMTTLLENHLVSANHVAQIAKKLAAFHRLAERIPEPPDTSWWLEQFKDVRQVIGFLSENLEDNPGEVIDQAIRVVENRLSRLAPRILQRYRDGFYIDGHGDLHSGNIFLLDEPVFFDCIEFNDKFRHLDVLDEMAFFCLDLDYYKQPELEDLFLKHYQEHYPCFIREEDQQLYLLFKCYRANVKLKVQSLKALQASNPDERRHRLQRAFKYYQLFKRYSHMLQKG